MTTATRQQHRREQFAAAVIAAGWASVDEFVTAVINGRQKVQTPSAKQRAHRAQRRKAAQEMSK